MVKEEWNKQCRGLAFGKSSHLSRCYAKFEEITFFRKRELSMYDIKDQIYHLCEKRLEKKEYKALLDSGKLLDYRLLLIYVKYLIDAEKRSTRFTQMMMLYLAITSISMSSLSFSLDRTAQITFIVIAILLSIVVVVWSLYRISPSKKKKLMDIFLLEQYLIQYIENLKD